MQLFALIFLSIFWAFLAYADETPLDLRGKSITLKCANGNFVTIDDSNTKLTCNKKKRAIPAQFKVGTNKSARILLQTGADHFCSVDKKSQQIQCDSVKRSCMSLYTQVFNADGTISLKCGNGKYMQVDQSDNQLKCAGNSIGQKEKFNFTVVDQDEHKKPDQVPTQELNGKIVTVQCPDKSFFTFDGSVNFLLVCNKTEPEYFDRFIIDHTPDVRISLKAVNYQKQYCSATDKNQRIRCNEDQVTNDELFVRMKNEDGSVSFKCVSNDKWMSLGSDKFVKCTGDSIGKDEKFNFNFIKDNKPPKQIPSNQVLTEELLNKIVTIKCPNSKFVTFDGTVDFGMVCRKDEAEYFDRFIIDRTPDVRISLKAVNYHKQYCTANEENQVLKCNKDQAEGYELFERKKNDDGTISLKCTTNKWSSDGKWISLTDTGELKCVGDQIGKNEKFNLTVIKNNKPPVKVSSNPDPTYELLNKIVTIKCPNSKFVSFDGTADYGMICRREESKFSVRFIIDRTPDVRMTLKPVIYQKQYCSANEDNKVITCNKDQVEGYELFERKKNDDGSVSFRCVTNKWSSDGKWISLTDSGELKCIGDQIGENEKFYFNFIKNNKQK